MAVAVAVAVTVTVTVTVTGDGFGTRISDRGFRIADFGSRIRIAEFNQARASAFRQAQRGWLAARRSADRTGATLTVARTGSTQATTAPRGHRKLSPPHAPTLLLAVGVAAREVAAGVLRVRPADRTRPACRAGRSPPGSPRSLCRCRTSCSRTDRRSLRRRMRSRSGRATRARDRSRRSCCIRRCTGRWFRSGTCCRVASVARRGHLQAQVRDTQSSDGEATTTSSTASAQCRDPQNAPDRVAVAAHTVRVAIAEASVTSVASERRIMTSFSGSAAGRRRVPII